MKTGMTLQEIAVELQRQQETKKDYVAPTTELEATVEDGHFGVRVNGYGRFDVRQTAHNQIANRLGIPMKYYERMRSESPNLLATNVNHWFEKEPEKRMLRTLDGNIRAFLSSRYRPLDNYDMAEAILPTLQGMGVTIESSNITESYMYLKVITPKLQFEIKVGDVVQAGLVISNSEIGLGSLRVEPLIYRLVCKNGLISADYSLQKYHIGRGSDSDGASEFYRDETRLLDDRAFWSKCRDIVRGALKQDVFQKIANKMISATNNEIKGDPVSVVETAQKTFGLGDKERGGILKHLIKGGDMSQFGLMNAVTAYSQEVEDYDRATELERLGGKILELPKTDWSRISEGREN